jgi:hypothetical protein
MTQVLFRDWTCSIQKRQYENGRVALRLVDEEGPVATATVNLPNVPLGKNQVLIKSYGENEGMLEALVAAGVVKPTGQTVRSGFVEVPVCELQSPFRESTHAEGVEQARGKGRVR